jgi:hypothetical protein
MILRSCGACAPFFTGSAKRFEIYLTVNYGIVA